MLDFNKFKQNLEIPVDIVNNIKTLVKKLLIEINTEDELIAVVDILMRRSLPNTGPIIPSFTKPTALVDINALCLDAKRVDHVYVEDDYDFV